MPTYTYECLKCHNTQDVFHSISASPEVTCPACGGKCRRLLGTGAGIIFKGSGFYETDYKRKNGSNGNGHKGSSANSGSKTCSTASDSGTTQSTSSAAKTGKD